MSDEGVGEVRKEVDEQSSRVVRGQEVYLSSVKGKCLSGRICCHDRIRLGPVLDWGKSGFGD